MSFLINFDYDGVIADSFNQMFAVAQKAQKLMGKGRPPLKEDFQKTENLTFSDFAVLLGIAPENLTIFAREIFLILQKELSTVEAFEDMPELIGKLACKHKIVLITSNFQELVESFLKKYRLVKNISLILDGKDPASKSEKIKRAMNRFDFLPENTFMVGDTVGDIKQGKAAQVKTIAVTWGYQPEVMLKSCSPDYLVSSPQELMELFAGRMDAICP